MRRLYTFAASHFSEKARWALDHAGVTYQEHRLLPGLHVLAVRRLAPRTSVPVLVNGAEVVQGSSAIVARAEQLGHRRLTPDDEASARDIEARADKIIGRGIQRIYYSFLFDHPRELTALWAQDGPRWAGAFYRLTLPLLRGRVHALYRVTEAGVVEAKEELARFVAELDRRLERHDYLVGDTFSRADLTVAALLAPMVMPPEHVVRWPDPPHPALAAPGRPFAGCPTWNHVLRMYREHRRR
jgi:glutathione S-transferase